MIITNADGNNCFFDTSTMFDLKEADKKDGDIEDHFEWNEKQCKKENSYMNTQRAKCDRSAFPILGSYTNPYTNNETLECEDPGMNLRDWFAGQALAGYCVQTDGIPIGPCERAAQWCYEMADAMLKARE